jgi:hypothetical protein
MPSSTVSNSKCTHNKSSTVLRNACDCTSKHGVASQNALIFSSPLWEPEISNLWRVWSKESLLRTKRLLGRHWICLSRLVHYVKQLKTKGFFSDSAFPFKTSFELLATANGQDSNKLYQVPQICTPETNILRFRNVRTHKYAFRRPTAKYFFLSLLWNKSV